jgi:hypothetical protein
VRRVYRPKNSARVSVHSGPAAVASREAHQDGAHWHCRARELAAGGAKGGGHSGDPYRLHKRAVEGRRRAGVEVEPAAAVKLRRYDDTGVMR